VKPRWGGEAHSSSPFLVWEECALQNSEKLRLPWRSALEEKRDSYLFREGLQQWLSAWEWDYFLTVTFRDSVPMDRASSVLNAVARTASQLTPERLFLVSETHVSGALHMHGLFKTGTKNRSAVRQRLWRGLFNTYGRSDVQPVAYQEAVSKYVSKYVTKNMQEWGIF